MPEVSEAKWMAAGSIQNQKIAACGSSYGWMVYIL
jgi:hypothetical protein